MRIRWTTMDYLYTYIYIILYYINKHVYIYIYIYNNGIYIYIYVYETLSLHPSSSNHFPMLLYEFDNSQDVLQGLQRRTTGSRNQKPHGGRPRIHPQDALFMAIKLAYNISVTYPFQSGCLYIYIYIYVIISRVY